jgi:hypothetical protein
MLAFRDTAISGYEEKTNDYENFEKGMIYMKILKKGGVVEKRGEEETKSMPHAPVCQTFE